MDRHTTLAAPADAVFAHQADPVQLDDWLPQIVGVNPGPPSLIGTGPAFTVTVRTAAGDEDITAEVAAHEPPWLIAYRLMVRASPLLIRATCTANPEGTQVHVHQSADSAPLLVDLSRLPQLLNSGGMVLRRRAEPTDDVRSP